MPTGDGEGEGYFQYWGKAGLAESSGAVHLLAYHSLDVAAVGAELLARDPLLLGRIEAISGFSAAALRTVLPFLLALHDLGKFSERFQDLRPDIVAVLKDARPPRFGRHRHDSLGHLLWREWSRRPRPEEATLVEELFPIEAQDGILDRRDVDDVLAPWMAAIFGHHGRPPVDDPLGIDEFPPRGEGRSDAAAFARAAFDLLAPGRLATASGIEPLIGSAAMSSWWIAGLTILCDWIGSDANHFPPESAGRPLSDYWSVARERAARAVGTSGLCEAVPRPFRGIASLFPSLAGAASPLQALASIVPVRSGAQLHILEDLTGSGKTEAALILAHRLMSAGQGDGIYFALPTMATANAMDRRTRPLLERLFEGTATYLLSHSGPRLTDEDRLAIGLTPTGDSLGEGEPPSGAEAASAWMADNRKKALLAHLGVGTIDQALLAVLQSRHAALRLLGVHRRVLIVDEVHACDAYMHRILCRLLEAQAALGGSAVLLSATLPRTQRKELAASFAGGLGSRSCAVEEEAYPLLTSVGREGVDEIPVRHREDAARTVGVSWLETVEETVAWIVAAARQGRCICWVRNSVLDACEAFDTLVEQLGRDRVTLFHARFALLDRLRIEDEVVGRFGIAGASQDRGGRVVVATQVVEQSLDIDFDEMVSDLCPVDLVIQRAGRLQRHPKVHPGRPAPVMHILAPPWSDEPGKDWLSGPFRRTGIVYPDPGVLWRTARELQRARALDLPRGARRLVEAVYGADDVPSSLVARSDAAIGSDLAKASVAQSAVIKLRLGYVRDGSDWAEEASTPTRLGEPTTTVRLARIELHGAVPWASDAPQRLRWSLSQVSVARRLIARSHPEDAATCLALEAGQPFVGDDICTLPLREDGPDRWVGRAVAVRRKGAQVRDVSVRVTYSPGRGLQVTQGD